MRLCSRNIIISASALLITALALVLSAFAQETPAQQAAVVTIQEDPMENLESTCIGIQIGISQLGKGSRVSLFPTLDGVDVVNNEVLEDLYPNESGEQMRQGFRPIWDFPHRPPC